MATLVRLNLGGGQQEAVQVISDILARHGGELSVHKLVAEFTHSYRCLKEVVLHRGTEVCTWFAAHTEVFELGAPDAFGARSVQLVTRTERAEATPRVGGGGGGNSGGRGGGAGGDGSGGGSVAVTDHAGRVSMSRQPALKNAQADEEAVQFFTDMLVRHGGELSVHILVDLLASRYPRLKATF